MSTVALAAGRPGLVSVTFRQLTPEEIIQATKQSGLSVIEWGGDVHVPPGNNQRARAVAAMMREAGLETACYGSYYRVGHDGENGKPLFADVLAAAAALGAPCIRVWAGTHSSTASDQVYFDRVCADADRIAGLAQERGIRIAFEFHDGTIHDTAAAAERLLAALPHPNIFSLWQPSSSLGDAERLDSLRVILPRLAHVHVFQWQPGDPVDRRPLAEGRESWGEWFALMNAAGQHPDALLEFVRGDDPSLLPAEAATLRELLGQDAATTFSATEKLKRL
jgi:sugar phosphate isomerase/epimerase